MILQPVFNFESWMDTHDLPLVVIDENLLIVAVNGVWKKQFGPVRNYQATMPCCEIKANCRHRQFFETHEAYAGYVTDEVFWGPEKKQYRVKGNPIRDTSGALFISETVSILKNAGLNFAQMPMIGISPAFLKLQAELEQVAKTSVPVLLSGETGTGKEVAAQLIHKQSNKTAGDFVVVDCTLLTENLFESELFGHEKGAFTNAVSSKKGLFELANNGTLFLDEIGELPLSQQPKLLRALESGQFRRVGGTKTLASNVRVISATHKKLGEMVKAGTFREDLFYRLSFLSIEIPPLRDRIQDIPLLAAYLLEQESGAPVLTEQALTKLLQHRWPGNIRELKNCLQLAAALAEHSPIDKQHINILRRGTRAGKSELFEDIVQRAIIHPPEPLMASEKDLIKHLIVKFQGNRKLIATELGISERTLYRKLNQYQLV